MITENKLIAEFMGYELKLLKYNKCYSPKYNDGTIAPIKFNSDWNWLMPVVEQIENLGFEFTITDTSIETTYKAVVQFIKEYNNQLNK